MSPGWSVWCDIGLVNTAPTFVSHFSKIFGPGKNFLTLFRGSYTGIDFVSPVRILHILLTVWTSLCLSIWSSHNSFFLYCVVSKVFAADLLSSFLSLGGGMIAAWSWWTIICGRLVPAPFNTPASSVVGSLENIEAYIFDDTCRGAFRIHEAGKIIRMHIGFGYGAK